jgi:hypothetical protein
MPSPAPRDAERRAGRILLGAFAASTILFSGQFPPFANPNELSRLETVFAFVESGTFRIDGAIRVLGDHEDKAVSEGHFYSNKAPGLSLAAIPVYRLLRIFLPAPRSPFAPIFFWMRLATVSSICVLALARFRARLWTDGFPGSSLVAAAVAFGTPYLFYARSFLSHAWTAALLLLSWDLLRLFEEWRFRRRVNILPLGAGFLAGWAAISEYPVAVLAALLAVRAASGRSWRRAALFAVGASIPIGVLLAYDAACFGSPLVLSSAREALPQYAALSARGVFGMGFPNPAVALAYLFHPARGLLLFSPFLLWSAVGLASWLRGRHDRADGWLILAATALFFVLMCGYPNWHGGWALGNRYLLPVLFFPALAIGRGLAPPGSRLVFAAAAVYSIAVHLILTATWPHFPLNVPWPPVTGSAWFLARGWLAPGAVLSSPLALALGLAAALAAVLAALGAAGLPRNRAWVAPVVGLLPLAVALAFPPRLSFGGRLWRAAVYGRFSGRDPDRQELKRVMADAVSPSERGRARDAWRLFGPEPPGDGQKTPEPQRRP